MTSQSQAGQDLWVVAMTEGKSGFYLDIGCNNPIAINNTYLLESGFGWTGILVDLLPGCETRKGKFFQCDSANPTPELLEAYRTMPAMVDFLSLDVDEATLATFNTLPWSSKRFRVCCIEHDAYLRGAMVRNEICERMSGMDYVLVCADVGIRFPNSSSPVGFFEDWYADPQLVKPELISKFACSGKEWTEIVKDL